MLPRQRPLTSRLNQIIGFACRSGQAGGEAPQAGKHRDQLIAEPCAHRSHAGNHVFRRFPKVPTRRQRGSLRIIPGEARQLTAGSASLMQSPSRLSLFGRGGVPATRMRAWWREPYHVDELRRKRGAHNRCSRLALHIKRYPRHCAGLAATPQIGTVAR